MKILAAINFLSAGRAWWGRRGRSRGRGFRRGGGGNLFGGRRFFGRMLHHEDLANLAVGCLSEKNAKPFPFFFLAYASLDFKLSLSE